MQGRIAPACDNGKNYQDIYVSFRRDDAAASPKSTEKCWAHLVLANWKGQH